MARVARFYGWPPAVLLDMPLRQMFWWNDLGRGLEAEEHLDAMMAVGVWHLDPKARRQYLADIRATASGGGQAPGKLRGQAAKRRLGDILAGRFTSA